MENYKTTKMFELCRLSTFYDSTQICSPTCETILNEVKEYYKSNRNKYIYIYTYTVPKHTRRSGTLLKATLIL